MDRFIIFCITFSVLFLSTNNANAEKGLSLRGGILLDYPQDDVFEDMDDGIGYIASLGYEFFEIAGADLGVMHSTHEYRLGLRGRAVANDNAERTAIFIRARLLPLKTEKYEIDLGAGPAFYSITGNTESDDFPFDGEEGFSGWGYTAGLDLKHFTSRHLSITFYISANLVKYSKQSFNTRNVEPPTRLPEGDSFSWGLTLFYRIGIIKL